MSHHVYHRLSSRQKRGRGAGHKSRLDVRQDQMGTVDDREKNFEELDLLPRLEIIRYNLIYQSLCGFAPHCLFWLPSSTNSDRCLYI